MHHCPLAAAQQAEEGLSQGHSSKHALSDTRTKGRLPHAHG